MKTISLILPKNHISLDLTSKRHVYFLAGPGSGGGDWQAEAIELLSEENPDCYIVCPCRYDTSHRLFRYSLPVNSKREFQNQTQWERYYLDLASNFGCIIFWLPCEDQENPRKDGQPYARDSYGELSRWSIKSCYAMEKPIRMVIGAEENFPGLKVIRRNLNEDHGWEYPICDSLEKTVHQAILMANK